VPIQLWDIQNPVFEDLAFSDADGAGPFEITDSAPRNRVFTQLLLNTDDNVDHLITLWFGGSTAATRLGSATLPALAGRNGTPAFEVLSHCLPTNTPYLVLPPGNTLWIELDASLSAGKVLNGAALGGILP